MDCTVPGSSDVMSKKCTGSMAACGYAGYSRCLGTVQ